MNSVGTFVVVGNGRRPFPRLLNAVGACLAHLPKPVIVQHGIGSFDHDHCLSRSFLKMDEFSYYIEKAELLVLHAGAGSVIHAIKAGKMPIVMPRLAKYDEVIDDHQIEFAEALDRLGKIVLVKEPHDLLKAVAEIYREKSAPSAFGETPRLIGLLHDELRQYAQSLKKS